MCEVKQIVASRGARGLVDLNSISTNCHASLVKPYQVSIEKEQRLLIERTNHNDLVAAEKFFEKPSV